MHKVAVIAGAVAGAILVYQWWNKPAGSATGGKTSAAGLAVGAVGAITLVTSGMHLLKR